VHSCITHLVDIYQVYFQTQICSTPRRVLLLPSCSISQLFPVQKFWLSIHPPRTHLPLHISHIHKTNLCEVSYERILLSRSTNILIRLCTGRRQIHITSFIQSSLSLSRLLLIGSCTDFYRLRLAVPFVMPRFTTFLTSSCRLNQGFTSTLKLRLSTGEFSFIFINWSTSHH
jgi:hypothetical protein